MQLAIPALAALATPGATIRRVATPDSPRPILGDYVNSPAYTAYPDVIIPEPTVQLRPIAIPFPLERKFRFYRLHLSKIHDARIAALCIDHGGDALWTADRDFSRFPSLRALNPLAGAETLPAPSPVPLETSSRACSATDGQEGVDEVS